MEEDLPVRYCFMMLLAIADPKGYAIGTDIALARRMNMPVEHFKECIAELMKPDADSNSKENDGRRVIESDCERGYFVVNYAKYRDTRDEEHRREYMREYMRKKREPKQLVNCKQRKPTLAKAEEEVKGVPAPQEAVNPPKKSPTAEHTPHAEFIHLWTEEYPKHHDGSEYAFNGGRDGKGVKELLQSSKLTPSELVDFAVEAWGKPTGFHCKNAASISGFARDFNDIRHELRAPKNGKADPIRPTSDWE